MTATDYMVWGLVVHLVVDWLFQNHWQATYKTNLRHPAAYVHSGLHTVALLLVFPWFVALAIGFTHLLIDTRKPPQWWGNLIKQTAFDPTAPTPAQIAAMTVAFWRDQVFHILVIAIAALLTAKFYALSASL